MLKVNFLFQPLSGPYTELSEAYAKHDTDELRAVANKYQLFFQNVSRVKNMLIYLLGYKSTE